MHQGGSMSKTRIGVYLDDNILKMCDSNIERFDLKNRSELIEKALMYLMASEDSEITANIITPKMESTIRGAVRDSENHISRIIFKLAVETDMMMNIIAATNEIDKNVLRKLRGMCVEDVKRTYGNISFDEAVENQKG